MHHSRDRERGCYARGGVFELQIDRCTCGEYGKAKNPRLVRGEREAGVAA